MTVMLRARPKPTAYAEQAPVKTAPAPKPVSSVLAIRRVTRGVDPSVRKKEEARQKIFEQLQLIAQANQAIDNAQQINETAFATIDSLMREQNMTIIDNGTLIAEITEKFTRQTRTVDPKRFRAKVTQDDFFSVIKVNVTDAERLLSGKELLAVVDIERATSLGHKLEIKEIKRKR